MRVFYLNNNPDLTRDQLALESEAVTITKLLTEPESIELLERLQRTRGRVGREDSRHFRPLGPPRFCWVFGSRLSLSSTSVNLFSAFHDTLPLIFRSSFKYTFTVNHLAGERFGTRVAFGLAMAPKQQSDSDLGGPCIQMELSLPSEAAAISPFVDKLMLLITRNRCAPGNETDIEIALREALTNAVIHGNHEDPQKQVHVSCRCEAEEEVSIVVRDEGQGFDDRVVPDPTAPGAIESSQGRGIYLMKALMDEVRFEQSAAVVHMRKKSGKHALRDLP
jgi:serine/threonine-protein kinase RsbW